MEPVRIVVVDDHPIFRDGLRRLLEAEPNLAVVGEAVDAAQAVALTAALHPDIVLLDVAMPRVSGVDAVHTLVALPNPPKVILLTAAIEKADILKAMQQGARGVVLKESATALLLKAIRIVIEGGYWVGRESVSDLLIVEAAGNKKIAESLNISEKTVKHHLTNIFEKLGVTSRLELALFAAQHNIKPRDA